MACDMPEPCKSPSLDSCQKRTLWTHKEVHLAPYTVTDLVLKVSEAGKFPRALDFKSLILFFRVSKQGPCFKATEEKVGDKRLVKPEPPLG